jgi:hypothetical protein
LALHLTYRLSRRQCWRVHLGIWRIYWIPLLAIHATVAGVIVLAWQTTWWFLLLLWFGAILPPIGNFWRWVAGLVRPLFGGRRVDIVIEGDGIGADFRGHGREFIPFTEIRRIERFGDVWSILFDRDGVDIPVALVDQSLVDRMRAQMTPEP